jgi:hypothetical protein
MEPPNAPSVPSAAAPRHKQALAIDPSFGTVFICDRCRYIHLTIGEMQVRTDLAGFQSLVMLLNRAAANYELWAECNGSLAA